MPAAQAERIVLGAEADKADGIVGCIYPMTGRAAIYGEDSVEGIRLALADIERERAAGLPAPRLRVVVDDALSKVSYGLRLAEDFIDNDGAHVLCGMVSSGVAHAVSDLSRRRGVILVGTDHASSRLTIEAGHRHYFRFSNDTWISNAAGARYLRDIHAEQPWRRIAILNPDYDYGHVSRDDLLAAMDELGLEYEVVAELWPKLYEPDYSAYIQALRDAQPDIVVTALWGGDFLAFLKQAEAVGLFREMRIANFDTGANYDVLVSLGDTPPPGLILSARHHNNWPDTGYNNRFVQSFHDMTGALENFRQPLPEDPDGFASYIDPDTHQIVQAQAVGTPVPDTRFPPARMMLGNIKAYGAEDLRPPQDIVRQRREAASGGSETTVQHYEHP
jgi:branched-chain amino acid transport system substrate-binding protein